MVEHDLDTLTLVVKFSSSWSWVCARLILGLVLLLVPSKINPALNSSQ